MNQQDPTERLIVSELVTANDTIDPWQLENVDVAGLRDQLISKAWKYRDTAIENIKRYRSELPRGEVRNYLDRMLQDWSECKTIKDLLGKPRILDCIPSFATNQTSNCVSLFDRLDFLENGKRRLREIIFYPCVVTISCLVVGLFFLVFLVPEFDSIYNEFELDLPPTTEAVCQLSRVVNQFGAVPILLCSTLVLLVMVFLFRRFENNDLRRMRQRRPSTVRCFHDYHDFIGLGYRQDEALALCMDRYRGSFYDPDPQRSARKSMSWEHQAKQFQSAFLELIQVTPDPAVPGSVEIPELPVKRNNDRFETLGLNAQNAGDESVEEEKIQQSLAIAWAKIHSDRGSGSHLGLLHFFVQLALYPVVGFFIIFLFQSLFAPMLQLITGLT